jgi:hypothetical protein
MNERALTQAQPVGMGEWQVMREQASMLVQTGFLPNSIKSPEQAVAIILQGRELGIPTMAALQTINVIQGKPTVSPQLMLALIYRSHQLAGMDINSTDTACEVLMERKGVGHFSARFDLDDAKRQGLADKDNWKKQPRVMLKWRAVAACAREAFSDVVLGLYTPEEMGAEVEVSDDGAMSIVETRPIDRTTGEISTPALPEPEEVSHAFAMNAATGEVVGRTNAEGEMVRLPSQSEKDAYVRGLKRAEALSIDLAPFEVDANVSRDELIAMSRRLKEAIDAKAQVPAMEEARF